MGKGGYTGAKVPDQPLQVYLKGKVLDVTKFQRSHPGGAKALKIFKDRDATEQFNMYHSPGAHKKLDLMLQGAPDAPAEAAVATSKLGTAFAELDQKLHEMGLYKPAYGDETFKLFLTLAPGILGARLVCTGMPALGGFLMAFSFYLAGWTAHDYLHHGVFKGSQSKLVSWNNLMGIMLGGWQGFSTEWWRARHNTHHLVTNEKGNDPDIRTRPVFTFVKGNPKLSSSLNAVQRLQQYYYVPMMSALDMYWRFESMQVLAARPLKKVWHEWLLLGVHYAVLGWIFAGQYQWLLFCTLCRGFMTGIVVFATHYGEDLLDGDHGLTLVEQTALTSRNITGGYLVNLLTGYISLQTEHHLFPMMPTANLEACQPLVRSFFKEHNLLYRESNLVECVKLNIRALALGDAEPLSKMHM